MEKKEKNFEEKLEELEGLVKQLENGDVPLDEAIDSFTKATKLAGDLDNQLKKAEESLSKIVNDDGSLSDFKEQE